MKKSEIQVGKIYRTAAGLRLKVKEIVENETQRYYSRLQNTMVKARNANTRYICENMTTHRENVVKSATKFVKEVSE